MSQETIQPLKTNIKITAQDLFSDYSGPKKETLVHRVLLALTHLQSIMRKQIDQIHLINLKTTLKNQTAFKNLQQKLHKKQEECQQFKDRISFYEKKLQDLTMQFNLINLQVQQRTKQCVRLQNYLDEKSQQINRLKLAQKQIQAQKHHIQKQKQQIQQKYLIANASVVKQRSIYINKLQQEEHVFKIRTKQIAQELAQDMQMRYAIQNERNSQKYLQFYRNRTQKKHQKIQVNIGSKFDQKNSPRSPRKRKNADYQHKYIQTDQTEQKMIRQAIESGHDQQIYQNLQQIHLMFSNISNSIRPSRNVRSPSRIIKKTLCSIAQTQVQTDFDISKYRLNFESIQISTQTQNDMVKQCFQQLENDLMQIQKKYLRIRQIQQTKYKELQLILQKKMSLPDDLNQIAGLKLKVKQLQLLLQKKQYQVKKQRSLYLSCNKALTQSQTEPMKSIKIISNTNDNWRLRKTSSGSRRRNTFATQQSEMLNYVNLFSNHQIQDKINTHIITNMRSKGLKTDQEIIRVKKDIQSVKYYVDKRHSEVVTSHGSQTKHRNSQKQYKKYSFFKKREETTN